MRFSRLLLSAAAIAVAGVALATPAYAVQGTPAPSPAPTAAPVQAPLQADETEPAATPAPSPAAGAPAPTLSAEAAPLPQTPTDQKPGTGERGLPVTGAQIGGLVVLGGGLIAAGIAMLAVRRRGPTSVYDLVDG